GRLLTAAAGNALFLEQLAASLGEGETELPPTIQALLAARLERLGPGERDVLARAAVLGREARVDTVADLLPSEARPRARRHLQALAARGLLQAAGADAYAFRHVLIQEAAYRSIPKAVRADLHECYADLLDGEDAELLGNHLERAYRFRAELGHAD